MRCHIKVSSLHSQCKDESMKILCWQLWQVKIWADSTVLMWLKDLLICMKTLSAWFSIVFYNRGVAEWVSNDDTVKWASSVHYSMTLQQRTTTATLLAQESTTDHICIKQMLKRRKQFHYYLINCCLILFFTVWWGLWLCLLNALLLTEFNVLLTTVRLMSVENAESVSSAFQQDSKSLNELLRTTRISTCCTDRML